MQEKQFLSPCDVARELSISSSTVLRMIHSGELPAIAVSERIYRIPTVTFERYKAGTLRTPELAPVGHVKKRPRLGSAERLSIAKTEALRSR